MSDWMARAACKGRDSRLWYPDPGDQPTVRAAKAICAECPVQQDCLAHAIRTHEKHGIWGGESIGNHYRRRGRFVTCGTCEAIFPSTLEHRGYCSPGCAEQAVRIRRPA